MYLLLKIGDFPASHVSELKCVNHIWRCKGWAFERSLNKQEFIGQESDESTSWAPTSYK